MRVVLCGPSGARCGVCVTTTLWALGFKELGVDLRWLTNIPLGERGIFVDPLVADVDRYGCYGRPDDATTKFTHTYHIAEAAFSDGCDLFFLEWSASVISLFHAMEYLRYAKTVCGARTVVRLHSQLLQGLSLDYVDAIIAPFSLADANVLADSEVHDVPPFKWHAVPHPCGPKVVEPDIARKHVIGYGQTHRMDHRYIRRAVEDAGYIYTTFGTGEEWLGIDNLLHGLSEAQAIVLFYSPLRGIGRSSALNLVLGAQRPVFVSDSLWLEDAEQWGGVCDDAEMVMRGIAAEREPNESQRAYYACWNPKAAAQRILEIAPG